MAKKQNKKKHKIPSIYESDRISFAKAPSKAEIPDLLSIQIESFKAFFQVDTPADKRKEEGLYKVFKENFPVTDSRENFVLEFLDYTIDPPQYSVEECKERGLTYSVSLKAKFFLYCTDPEYSDFEPKTQEVYLGKIPYMTPNGTFIINGAERVVVSLLHRAPGIFFGQTLHTSGIKIYNAKVVPFKGSWVEFTTDPNNILWVYIEGKKKFPATTFLRAIGYSSDKDILMLFNLAKEEPATEENLKRLKGKRLAGRVVKTWMEDFVDQETGEVTSVERREVLVERGDVINDDVIELILESGQDTILILTDDKIQQRYSVILETLKKDPADSETQAAELIYRTLRSADPPDEETARRTVEGLFFNPKRYNLGEVGRYRINRKLHQNNPNIPKEVLESQVLTKEDVVAIIEYIVKMINGEALPDDQDHLSNRRVRTIGEHLYNQFSVGLSRLAKAMRERMNIRDSEIFSPSDLINTRILTGVVNQFFATGQLSQFMDQTNPLSELTNKRRISAVGPGGLSREHAGFEVRDVHYSHYGRLCPIETPEGPSIGLTTSLCVYAKVNRLGFLETPYFPVKNGKVDFSRIVYLSPEKEQEHTLVPATVPVDEEGNIIPERVQARRHGDYPIVSREEVEFMDVATNQMVSVSTSLIPFLEHDDANRALMGSNMQRQAVPLLEPEAPIVGTGMERKVAADSRRLIIAEGKGEVVYVDANEIHIRYERDEKEALVSFEGPVKVYKLPKFKRTNQNTCINMRPLVRVGDKVEKGMVLCEGFCTAKGELALGKNLLVAFMPWRGYNFEDAIVISERLVIEDVYTSIHIDEFEVAVRETNVGREELVREIPNVSEKATKNLDENGIVRIGAEVREGDIIVGKVTPKSESDATPEERLLRAIFGDKAGEVKNTSLTAPPAFYGIVIDKKLFSAQPKYDDREYIKKRTKQLEQERKQKLSALDEEMMQKLEKLVGKAKIKRLRTVDGEELAPKGKPFSKKYIKRIPFLQLNPSDWTEDEELNQWIERLFKNYRRKYNEIDTYYRRKMTELVNGDELQRGILQLAKVYIARKRKIKVGDKMAGRHGNKGVIAKVVRQEDMPFLEDGTPVDIVLNPLGVPSRMNIGQIYETLLGWAGKRLGVKFACPIFDGASLDEINQWLKKAGLPKDGITYLYDGRTGERFDQPATVGYIYMMKLHHLVDDKMHARSIGPYSLITQQPLGGKSQFGGQRFGEMEVWALEAFGAAHILREMLTIKSDDVEGRSKTYEAIVKGYNIPEPGMPESFRVLVHELRGLALEITLE